MIYSPGSEAMADVDQHRSHVSTRFPGEPKDDAVEHLGLFGKAVPAVYSVITQRAIGPHPFRQRQAQFPVRSSEFLAPALDDGTRANPALVVLLPQGREDFRDVVVCVRHEGTNRSL
jgi:hypothetical protein